jgi:glycosyltransferase involved in cell wall biosynthesis
MFGGQSQIDEIVEHVTRRDYERIVFIEHLPPPVHVIKALTIAGIKTPFVLHLFGCLPEWVNAWVDCKDLFDGHPFKIFVPSQAQKNLIAGLFSNQEQVEVFPFPINEMLFFPEDPSERHIFLNSRLPGRNENHKVILSPGRICLGKNPMAVIEAFELWCEQGLQADLVFVGDFDDTGAVFFESGQLMGTMYKKFQDRINASKFSARIHLKPHAPQQELRKYLSYSDLFVSFSLYNDEDFGMAPLESLFCGTPALITAWAGYKSYDFTKFCTALPLHNDQGTLKFQYPTAQEVLALMETRLHAAEMRRAYVEKFSLPQCALRLQKMLTSYKEFSGFSATAKSWAQFYSEPKHVDQSLRHYQAYYE